MTNLIKSIILIAAWLSATATEAHQPNISSVMLIEQESGTWTVQFNAGILGFQYAVEEEHGKGSYSTVEKFNQLLLAHLRENMEILINSEKVELTKGIVKLGHAATVIFELSEAPEELNQVFVKNEAFKAINNSQSIFSIVKQGLDRDQFILSSENDFQTEVIINNNQILMAESSVNDDNWILIATTFIALLAGLSFVSRKINLYRSPVYHTIKE
ncbi:hypothetical protein AAOE16_03015 [Ekhidna sp. MALMAid0563]|uniref:hypothetical protein n=1 Tax=Ekhidna sp. MALMAid0563 TaxID=3143937 RepID=UPI0032DE8A9F